MMSTLEVLWQTTRLPFLQLCPPSFLLMDPRLTPPVVPRDENLVVKRKALHSAWPATQVS